MSVENNRPELGPRQIRTTEIGQKAVVVFVESGVDPGVGAEELRKKLGELGYKGFVVDPHKTSWSVEVLPYDPERYGSLGRATEEDLMDFINPESLPQRYDCSDVWRRLYNRSAKLAGDEEDFIVYEQLIAQKVDLEAQLEALRTGILVRPRGHSPEISSLRQQIRQCTSQIRQRGQGRYSSKPVVHVERPFMFVEGENGASTPVIERLRGEQNAPKVTDMNAWLDMDIVVSNYQLRPGIFYNIDGSAVEILLKDFTNSWILRHIQQAELE